MLKLPQDVSTALSLLRRAGFRAYPVGGCVRDALLGQEPQDWDLCTDATPEEMHRAFAGCQTEDTGARLGTVTLLLSPDRPLEITSFRTESDYSDSRHPDGVTFTRSLEADLARRDFTVNAMAWDTERNTVIDPFGGKGDLEEKLLRCVGDPALRFSQDALRILRGMRFRAKPGFEIEKNTFAAMLEKKALLHRISPERAVRELNGLLTAEAPGDTLLKCKELLFELMPALRATDGCPQHSPYHDRDVWRHTALAVDNAKPELTLRWAALLHDIGKPACHMRDAKGIDHFTGHQETGAQMAEALLKELKMPASLINRVTLLVREHDTLLADRDVWPLLARLGSEAFDQLLRLKHADLMAHAEWVRPRVKELPLRAALKERILKEGRPLSVGQLALDGNDLQSMGFRGRQIGAVLEKLFSRVLRQQLGWDRASLLKAAEAELSARE